MTNHCRNGRVTIKAGDKQYLWALSAGYCARPECRANLFASVASDQVPFNELAHIISTVPGSPRDDAAQRSDRDNVVLLCANCHSLVDRAPDEYDAGRLREWQRAHMQQIAALFGATRFASRSLARAHVLPILEQNRSVFDTYGPMARATGDLGGADDARQWRRKVREVILPNDRRLLAVLDQNRHLLTPAEQAMAQQLRQHVDDLEARHYGNTTEPGATRFPAALEDVFADDDPDGDPGPGPD